MTNQSRAALISESGWRMLNRERGLLIDKNIDGTLSDAERARLTELNALCDERIELFRKLRKAMQ